MGALALGPLGLVGQGRQQAEVGVHRLERLGHRATGNVTQQFNLTRVGESALIRIGFRVDTGKDAVGIDFMIEPRFLPRSSRSQLAGAWIAPAGAYGLE